MVENCGDKFNGVKEYSYSKEKVINKAGKIFLLLSLFSCFIYYKTSAIPIFFIPIFFTFHYIHLISRVLTIEVDDNNLYIKKRRFWFFTKEIEIIPDNGVYQYWEYTYYIQLSKDYIYVIKKNGYQLFRITPSDEWEKETIEDMIKEVKKIGIPLKGNLKDTIGD